MSAAARRRVPALVSASLAILALLCAKHAVVGAAAECTPTIDAHGSAMPVDVDPACQQSFAAFNIHSWASFLFLTRAGSSTRGEMDPAQPFGSTTGSLLFETYKAHWEVFRDGETPEAWDNTPASPATPCPQADTKPGDLLLSSYSQLEDLWQVKNAHSFDGPLVAQNGTMVRYAIAYNRILFDSLVQKRLYNEGNLGQKAASGRRPTVEMPVGSVAVKSAWMILTSNDTNRERYRWRKAWVRTLRNSADNEANGPIGCTEMDVALVGLHIMQKTSNNPQWIWSTFEHADNLGDLAGAQKPFRFHDGVRSNPMPIANPNVTNGVLAAAPVPFNVEREVVLNPMTMAINTRFVSTLAQNAVWRHYQLVMTQWPRSTAQPQRQADSIPGGKISLTSPKSSFANPVFETFFQRPRNGRVYGCMQCHNNARDASDYIWSPVMHAWKAPNTPKGVKERVIEATQKQLEKFEAETSHRRTRERNRVR